ncbi:hypothetical protein FTZ77_08080 [Salmonella enterica]|uniref:Gp26 n=1 Tax=Salmonella enterica TaxID=28901 RepID=A0A5U1J6S3_SALER|nr:hypothetical protein [Salmonella enterica]EBH8587242.1 hypothetical protein [Salmonella enterica subsp. enterica serovar Pomona]EBL4292041.1 hypothetical protein [Salmonella enterica subsp. enterica serovar Rubislaw]EBL6422289.1 hypothetical protein [Salmonella enterica subsp. enterica serovar Give]ECE0876966.1 hypothetical protein [Salmonella enterica subsp. enterica serovar Abaetetuba]EDS5133804.1 hypothetical protein [Salmonella enterica subsp. enterica serovar Minnesota]EDV2765902.1 hy
MTDVLRIRRESLRWCLLVALNKARPYTTSEQLLFDIARSVYPDTTKLEVRQELDYLSDRRLTEITRQPGGMWFADLTRTGIDLVEYTIPCEPGIARPDKYWSE